MGSLFGSPTRLFTFPVESLELPNPHLIQDNYKQKKKKKAFIIMMFR